MDGKPQGAHWGLVSALEPSTDGEAKGAPMGSRQRPRAQDGQGG